MVNRRSDLLSKQLDLASIPLSDLRFLRAKALDAAIASTVEHARHTDAGDGIQEQR
ncbi:hypothetical protein [Lentzea sp. NPDC051838]|uniref:hypothetical protein n=1 Tax=Lentzea sp. NPDC051838 TaxID=3154849 RepID=UPI0034480223